MFSIYFKSGPCETEQFTADKPVLWFPSSSPPSSVWWRIPGLPSGLCLCIASPEIADLEKKKMINHFLNFWWFRCATKIIHYIQHSLETCGGCLYTCPKLSGSFLWRPEGRSTSGLESSRGKLKIKLLCDYRALAVG